MFFLMNRNAFANTVEFFARGNEAAFKAALLIADEVDSYRSVLDRLYGELEKCGKDNRDLLGRNLTLLVNRKPAELGMEIAIMTSKHHDSYEALRLILSGLGVKASDFEAKLLGTVL